jgi:ribosomal-protein-alanine N-acetyltransferase
MSTRYASPEDQALMEHLSCLHTLCLGKTWGIEEVKSLLRKKETFGLLHFDGEEANGFVIFQCVAGEGEILNIGVLPEARQSGIGGMLLKEVIGHCRKHEASALWLEVAESNRPALALYEKYGFVQKGRRKDYYPARQGHEDALTFMLSLSSD